MAFLEDTLGGIGGWGGGLAIGVGVAFGGPVVLAVGGAIVRPVAKTLVRSVLLVADGVRDLVASTSEGVSDLVAEVMDERASGGSRRSRAAAAHH